MYYMYVEYIDLVSMSYIHKDDIYEKSLYSNENRNSHNIKPEVHAKRSNV